MASSSPPCVNTSSLLISIILVIISLVSDANATALVSSCKRFNSIISFGDSMADTGNLLHLSSSNKPPHFALPPYGETYFHTATGRCSNGRLIIDFLGACILLITNLMGPVWSTLFNDNKNFISGMIFIFRNSFLILSKFSGL